MSNFQSGSRIMYRYKLNDNFDTKLGKEWSINNNLLSENWKDFNNRVEFFDQYIRTKANPNGVLDMQTFNPSNKKVSYDSKELFESEAQVYTIRDLGLMERDEIIKICQIYDIQVINQRTDHLIKLIIRKQKELMNLEGSSLNSTAETTSESISPSSSVEPQGLMRGLLNRS